MEFLNINNIKIHKKYIGGATTLCPLYVREFSSITYKGYYGISLLISFKIS